MHELARAVREIRDVLKGRGDTRMMYVLAYSGEGHDKQQRERLERHQQDREEQHQGDGEHDSPPALP
jgi:hypothetical protein